MMIRNAYTLLQAALLLLLASCTQEERPAAPGNKAQQLAISVTDGGYASADGKTTRAVENGYTTVFAEGDSCGLFVTRGWGMDKKMVYANVKLTAETDAATGQLVWKPEEGTTLVGGLENEEYHLYHPYKPDLDDQFISRMLEISRSDPNLGFFRLLENNWQVKADQSAYADYAASDLMTASCTPTPVNGTLRLDFVMAHRFALAVIELPRTVYKFTNARVPDYTVLDATFTGTAKPLRMADGSYRYLLPESLPTIEGSYDEGKREFAITPSDIGTYAGTYKKYKVDGAACTVKDYTIRRGDYLMADGHLLPKATALTEEQKAKVAAIVFWTPAETDPAGRLAPASLADDRIMARDFPHCTHGLAVAVKTVSSIFWQYNTDSYTSNVYAFQKASGAFSTSAGYKSIYIDQDESKWGVMKMVLGYQNTKIIEAYNGDSSYGLQNRVAPVEYLTIFFRRDNPAPSGSTGWYIPSVKELHMLICKDMDEVYKQEADPETRDIVNASLDAAGGSLLGAGDYWTSTENWAKGTAFKVSHSNGYAHAYNKKQQNLVRAVCAF